MTTLTKWLEGELAPFMTSDVLIIRFKPRGGRIVKDKINIELEQIGTVPKHLLFDRLAMFGQKI
ncbi:MAG: hypothetical protein GDA50_08345 [Alphaproteobacteria bacterium GM202ARS2]|nr:hypothetical protein [Alphaproteobacteria bacterium GM202ARS2]